MTDDQISEDCGAVGVDEIIISALTQGMSYQEAGALAGVSAKTVQRRMAEPLFSAEVAAARSARAREITDRLGHLGMQALHVLEEAMADDQKVGVRLAAATASLRYFREYRAAGELDERLRELEATTAQLVGLIEEAGQ